MLHKIKHNIEIVVVVNYTTIHWYRNTEKGQNYEVGCQYNMKHYRLVSVDQRTHGCNTLKTASWNIK